MSEPTFEIGGRQITLPVRVRDGDQWSAQYFVPARAAQALVVPAGLEVVRLLPRRAMAMITFARYRDTDLGPYDELVLSFLARPRGGGASGIFPYRLPASQALAVEAGREIWGYPRFAAEIAITAEGGRVACELTEGGARALRIEVREDGPLRLSDPNLPNFSLRGGVLSTSPWEQEGRARARLGGARLELGSHPIADELRTLGLPKRAFMSATMRGLRATYGPPVELPGATRAP